MNNMLEIWWRSKRRAVRSWRSFSRKYSSKRRLHKSKHRWRLHTKCRILIWKTGSWPQALLLLKTLHLTMKTTPCIIRVKADISKWWHHWTTSTLTRMIPGSWLTKRWQKALIKQLTGTSINAMARYNGPRICWKEVQQGLTVNWPLLKQGIITLFSSLVLTLKLIKQPLMTLIRIKTKFGIRKSSPRHCMIDIISIKSQLVECMQSDISKETISVRFI